MMRSLFSGVSGLRTHQTRMDVIGNNIANVNTTAYKSMSINFADLMYQTTQAATGPNAETGTAGTNPKQIGLGVQTAAISTNITEEGATQSTGNPFDLKISGDEFFVVSNGTNTFFTRDGSFYVDAAGNLAMSSTGYNVMGWQVDETTGNVKKDTVSAIKVMDENSQTYPAEWTKAAYASGIIDWNDANQSENAGKTLNLSIYDNLGYSYTVKLSLHNGVKPDVTDATVKNYTFYTEVEDVIDSTGKSLLDADGDGVVSAAEKSKITYGGAQNGVAVSEEHGLNATLSPTGGASGSVKKVPTGGTTAIELPFTVNITDLFTTDATTGISTLKALGTQITTSTEGSSTPITVGEALSALYGSSVDFTTIAAGKLDTTTGTFTTTSKNLTNASVLTFKGDTGAFESASGADENGITLDLSNLGPAFTQVKIDFSKAVVSDNKGKSTVGLDKGTTAGKDTGRALGTLQGVSIQTNGMIYASYSNNQQKCLGQIAVAEFANASGLQKEGDNLYSATQNSGEFDGIGIDITANGDKMNTGVLEMSNVDLSSQFTDMITTQRGFQANSRIITVSDTLLEELVNLKR